MRNVQRRCAARAEGICEELHIIFLQNFCCTMFLIQRGDAEASAAVLQLVAYVAVQLAVLPEAHLGEDTVGKALR